MPCQPFEEESAVLAASKPRSVLIVDDDEQIADVLSIRLSHQGFMTTIANSGELARALVVAEKPDVVLLDINLPDADGLALCQEFADGDETCNIPVIIVSGMDSPDVLRRSRAAGCRFYVRKPYDPNALLALIERALDEVEPND